MNKISLDISRTLYDKVMADDILKVYRSINNCSLVPNKVLKLENDLLINSYCNNELLFTSKYLYYKSSIILKDIGLCIDEAQIESKFNQLVSYSNDCINDEKLDNVSKLKKLNNMYKNDFYNDYMSEITEEDVLKIFKGLNLYNKSISDISLLENKYINLVKDKIPNKLVFYKLAMAIKGIGTKMDNNWETETVFKSLLTYTYYILEISNIDMYDKLQLLDLVYFKYTELNFNSANANVLLIKRLDVLNKEINTLLKNIQRFNNDCNQKNNKEIEKKNSYSVLTKKCII